MNGWKSKLAVWGGVVGLLVGISTLWVKFDFPTPATASDIQEVTQKQKRIEKKQAEIGHDFYNREELNYQMQQFQIERERLKETDPNKQLQLKRFQDEIESQKERARDKKEMYRKRSIE